MSSLWTPGGEVPVGRQPSAPSPPPGTPGGPPPGGARSERPPAPAPEPGGFEDAEGFDEAEAEAVMAEMAEVRRQLAGVPASIVVANHALGLYELAAIHLTRNPPAFDEASLAIDALGGLVDAVRGRLGEAETTVTDALAQIRLGFVQTKAAAGEA